MNLTYGHYFDEVCGGIPYFYWVTANNANGESDFSASDTGIASTAVPAAPTNLQAQSVLNGIGLSWEWELCGVNPVFFVYRTDAAGATELIDTIIDLCGCTNCGSGCLPIDVPPQCHEPYWYHVEVLTSGGLSPSSNTDSAMMACTVTTGNPTGNGQIATQFTVGLGYDNRGRLEQVTHPSGKTQVYTYNELLGHQTVSYDGQELVTSTTYAASGVVSAMNLTMTERLPKPDRGGPEFRLSALSVEKEHDELNRLTSHKITVDEVTEYNARTLRYNDWGFLSQVDRTDTGFSGFLKYRYGDHGELTKFDVSGER